MSESPTPPPAPPPRRRGAGWVFGVIGLAILPLIGTAFLLHGVNDAIREWRSWLAEITQQRVRTTFQEEVSRVVSTQGETLEVAVLETNETVTRYDMRTLLDDLLYLGTTVSEIRVPVVFRYQIRLSEEWKLTQQRGRARLICPALHAAKPPALRTEGMEKKSEAGWLRFNAAENLAALERELTPALEKRADHASHVSRVREAARSSVKAFVRRWMPSLAGQEIEVRFADEESSPTP